MTMLKGWRPVVEDVRSEINRLRTAIKDAQFNSDFGSRMQIIKLRAAELQYRLTATLGEMKSEAAAQREMIDGLMAECRSEIKDVNAAIADLRILRAERSRANYLHCLQLKEQQEGGEA